MASFSYSPSSHYEADVGCTLAVLEPVFQRLLVHRRIPAAAAVVELTDANAAAVLPLHVECLDCDPEVARLRLMGSCPDYSYCRIGSRVLMLNDACIGFLVVFPQAPTGEVFIYGVAVVPRWRGTWAKVLLEYESFRALHARGISTVHFRAVSTKHDTLKQAARVQARPLD